MPNCSPLSEYIANELIIEVSAKFDAEHQRRRGEAIVALLYCMEKLRRLRGDISSCVSVQPMGRRD